MSAVVVQASHIAACPIRSLLASHYRPDGSCRCRTAVFQVGRTYPAHSVADHDTIWHFTVLRRTARFITLGSDQNVTRVGILGIGQSGGEWAFPLGRYSMAPVLRADRVEPEGAYNARAELFALGLTDDQMATVTGLGHRRYEGCDPDDTILNKYAAGALSATGVMGVLFGVDSPQHRTGSAL